MTIAFSKKEVFSVFISLALTVIVFIGAHFYRSETDSINNAVLGITALVVLWYTLETASMKEEMVKQNRLHTRPILTLIVSNSSPASLKNEGKGPALNASVKAWVARSLLKQEKLKTDEAYEIRIPPYISPNSACDLRIYRQNKKTGIKGTISELDIFNEIGKVITFTVQYEDIEGSIYKSEFQVRSGQIEWISFNDYRTL